jgi:hypothetical protein
MHGEVYVMFRQVIHLFVLPGVITGVAAYLLFRFRPHLFEMMCSIGFLAALFCLIVRPHGNLSAAIVMGASIIAVAAVRIVQKP